MEEDFRPENLPNTFNCAINVSKFLDEINFARTQPKKYAEKIKLAMKNFIEDKLIKFQGTRVTAIQGKSAYNEAIAFLEKQKPLQPLKINLALCLAADDHSVDMVKNNMFGHSGTDGSGLRDRIERRSGGGTIYGKMGECCDRVKSFHGPDYEESSVMRLIIDEGVPSRGHRKLIFTPEFEYVGISGRQESQYIKGTVDFCAVNIECQKNIPNSDDIGSKLTGNFSRDASYTEKRGIKLKQAPQKKQNKPKQQTQPKNTTTTNNTQSKPNNSPSDVVAAEDILKWVNEARTNPNKIATILQSILENDFIDDGLININGTRVRVLEGKPAYREAIQFLKKQKPLQPVELNECLSLAADDHVKDMIKNNMFGHTGTDGSSLTDRVTRRHGKKIYGQMGQCCDQPKLFEGPDFAKKTILRYILDEGVPSRGHRKLIFTGEFKFIGISMRKDQKNNGYKGTLDFCSLNLEVKGKQPPKNENSKPNQRLNTKSNDKNEIPPADVLHWVNEARTNPKKIATILQTKLNNDFINDGLMNVNGIQVMVLEGKPAYREAIEFLKKQKPLEALELNECLSLAAEDHVKDMIKNNIFGHTGTDGSSLTDRVTRRHGKKIYAQMGQCCDQPKEFEGPDFAQITVLRYILDEGVPSRGHRKLIYTQGFKYIGISMKKDEKNEGYKGTLDFCSMFLETKGKQSTQSKNTTAPTTYTPKREETPKKNAKHTPFKEEKMNLNDSEQWMQKMKENKFAKFEMKGSPNDIFDKLEMNTNAKGSGKKQVKSTSTSTKTVTTNGIKKTTVTKTTTYTDGTVETITTTT